MVVAAAAAVVASAVNAAAAVAVATDSWLELEIASAAADSHESVGTVIAKVAGWHWSCCLERDLADRRLIREIYKIA